jgi:hypothetical protein
VKSPACSKPLSEPKSNGSPPPWWWSLLRSCWPLGGIYGDSTTSNAMTATTTNTISAEEIRNQSSRATGQVPRSEAPIRLGIGSLWRVNVTGRLSGLVMAPDHAAGSPHLIDTSTAFPRASHSRQRSRGSVPWWAKDIKMGARCINAMAVTMPTEPAIRARATLSI